MKFRGQNGFVEWAETLGKVIISVILLLPGVIIGGSLKGLGYLSSTVQDTHERIIIKKNLNAFCDVVKSKVTELINSCKLF